MHPTGTRRIELVMRRPPLALYAGIRPTLIIDGRGQPIQWGRGTWQIPAGEPVTVGVFLFNRMWRFGQAEVTIAPEDEGPFVYRAPMLPFGAGRIGVARA